jgi:P2 family phage contractile tail tube protein
MPDFQPTLINYALWDPGEPANFLGMADVVLPDIQHEIASIKGAGISGTIDYPVKGHFQNIVATFNFYTPTRDALKFLRQRGRQLDLRGAAEEVDSGTGNLTEVGVRVSMMTMPTGLNLGTFEVAAATGTAATVTVWQLAIYHDEERIIEIDKLNMKAWFGGQDDLENVRRILGY